MNKFKRLIIALQNGDNLFWDGDSIRDENGTPVKCDESNLDWNDLEHLELGKCGELYAQYVLSGLGMTTFEALVDDHGVDLIAGNINCFIKVQVKTIRYDHYSFIKEGNPPIDERFFLLYIRVIDGGKPKGYFFPMNFIVNKLKKYNSKYGCFSYHKYIGKKSHPEYGISAAKMYFDDEKYEDKNDDFKAEEYCVSDGWNIKSDRFAKLIAMNKM